VHTARSQQNQSTGWAWYGLGMVLLLLSAGQTIAAEPQRWTLEQCLERALQSSPAIHEAQADVGIAESRLAQAKAGRLPQVTFTNIGGVVNAAHGDAITGHTHDDNLGPFTKGELEVVQPLYTFGRLQNEILAASKGVDTQHAATAQARNGVIAAVKELYYQLLFSQQLKELLDEVQQNFTKALDTAQQRLDAGESTITQQDILRLRIGLAGVTKETFTLARAIAVTQDALRRELGLPPNADFHIADTSLEPVELHLQPLATYLEQAGKNRPEFVRLDAGMAARQARLQAARSAYYPSFFVAGGLRYAVAPNRDEQDNPFLRDDFNYFDGGMALGLRWRLDFWMTRAKVAEQGAELSKVEVQKENAVSGIGLDVRRRYAEVQEAQQKLDAAQTARRAARALMVSNLTNFGLGIGEGKDVFESLGLYTRMASEYYTTVRDFNIAAAKLTQATGQEITTLSYQH
jgi:outer membrane protein